MTEGKNKDAIVSHYLMYYMQSLPFIDSTEHVHGIFMFVLTGNFGQINVFNICIYCQPIRRLVGQLVGKKTRPVEWMDG